MYQVSAAINNVETIEIPLNETFQPNIIKLLSTFDKDPQIRILFICSPNNPTGNLISLEGIKLLCSAFKGIVVIDEAYIDFCEDSDQLDLINQFNRVVILRTLSKAFGLAAIRLGIAIGHPDLITLLNKIKPPYNISGPSQQLALDALTDGNQERQSQVESIKKERQLLSTSLQQITMVKKVYHSDANFLLVKFSTKINATSLYHYLLELGIVVRDRSKQIGCDNCLRITIGTESENQMLLDTLLAYNLL
jgi:histidinol-phosphate aminotransferase